LAARLALVEALSAIVRRALYTRRESIASRAGG
jgi:hypothetical protein